MDSATQKKLSKRKYYLEIKNVINAIMTTVVTRGNCLTLLLTE